MRIFSYLITVPLALALVLFAVSNQQMIVVQLWPLPFESRELPLYTIVLVPAVLAFFLGGIVAWIGGGRARRLARQRKRALDALRDELQRVQAGKSRVDQAMTKMAEARRVETVSQGAQDAARRELPAPDRAA